MIYMHSLNVRVCPRVSVCVCVWGGVYLHACVYARAGNISIYVSTMQRQQILNKFLFVRVKKVQSQKKELKLFSLFFTNKLNCFRINIYKN